jgi:hypothetical protein
MSHRSTFSLAQLLLLVMLTGMFCVWLPKTQEWATANRIPDFGNEVHLSEDGSRLMLSDVSGFAVFDTATGKCLCKRTISGRAPVFDKDLKTVCIETFFENSRFTIHNIDTNSDREIVAPRTPDGAYPRGWGIDEDACYVESLIRINFPDRFRHWSLETGKVLSDVELETSGKFQLLRNHGTVTSFALDERLLVRWTRPNGELVESSYPVPEAEIWEFLCLSQSQDRIVVLMHEIPGSASSVLPTTSGVTAPAMPMPRTKQRFLVIAENTGAIRSLRIPDFDSVHPGQLTADGRQLIGFGTLRRSSGYFLVFVRMDLESGAYQVLNEIGEVEQDYLESRIVDVKLIDNDRQIALATWDGTFILQDASTGQEIRRIKFSRHSLGSGFWIALGGSGVAWAIMWWLATRRVNGTVFDAGPYLVFAVFFAALAYGIFVLAFFDPWTNLHHPSYLIPAAISSLLALAGFVLLFSRFCNKLSAAYTLLSAAAITAHACWLYSQSPH